MSLGVEYNVLERVRTFVRTKVPSKVQYISSYDTLSTFESTKVQLYVVVGLHVL
jgi:nitrogen-specific signal transduction histidine kinase